ncbi:hypothetical protein BD410DRAFT_89961 [Rickenella mellea]|uniref:F-box domain-containing protein n=1 Tax=Rickenella mellea TaxID=50990 RepID=A0A4Y7QB20_9AGAM|nr:hypothetical protein BD410DRAFT_89961 [Rickenella mellea]
MDNAGAGGVDTERKNPLISFLSHVEASRGSISTASLMDVSTYANLNPSEKFQALCTTLSDLKKLKTALRKTSEIIECAIVNFKEETLPLSLQCGIRTLPDKIIERILELACEGGNPQTPGPHHKFPILLSHISRRFRSLALQAPHIWANLSSQLSREGLKKFLARSRSVDLGVYIYDASDDYDQDARLLLKDFLKIVIQHKDRWSELQYHRFGINSVHGYSHPAFAAHRNLKLPRLQSLTYEKYEFCSMWEGRHRDLPNFFASWSMPKLCRFDGRNSSVQYRGISKSLTSCTLHFATDDEDDERNLHGSLEALSSISQLKHLVLKLSDHYKCNDAPLVGTILLQQLVSFKIDLKEDVESNSLTSLLSVLKMPRLIDMSAIIDIRSSNGDLIHYAITDAATRCSTLQKFTLEATNMVFRESVLWMLALQLPSLHEVILRGHGLCEGRFCHDQPPNWRSLRVESISLWDQKGLIKVVELMAKGRHWNDFRLHLVDCGGLSPVIPKLRILLGNKLHYET